MLRYTLVPRRFGRVQFEQQLSAELLVLLHAFAAGQDCVLLPQKHDLLYEEKTFISLGSCKWMSRK